MNEQAKHVETKSVSLYPEHWAVVMQVAKDYGHSLSGGLRFILSDWERRVAEETRRRAVPPGTITP